MSAEALRGGGGVVLWKQYDDVHGHKDLCLKCAPSLGTGADRPEHYWQYSPLLLPMLWSSHAANHTWSGRYRCDHREKSPVRFSPNT